MTDSCSALPAPKGYTSYSQLGDYKKCPRLYQHKHVEGLSFEERKERHFLLGTLVHRTLELFVGEPDLYDKENAFYLSFQEFLLGEAGFELDQPEEFLEVARKYSELLTRASARDIGPNRIRNRDGSVPKNLSKYPPSSWTTAVSKSGIRGKLSQWDNLAALEGDEIFSRESFCLLIAEAMSLIESVSVPDLLERNLASELGVSLKTDDGDFHNPVFFPGSKELLLKCYIDNVSMDAHGRVWIIDYKTSKQKPEPHDVMHMPQLLLYSYAYQQLENLWPSIVAIWHLPTAQIVAAPLDKDVLWQVLAEVQDTQQKIDSGIFPRCNPTDYGSPCVRRDYVTQEVFSCPYLGRCWPRYAEALKVDGV
jgi:hypothetical protein